MRRVMLVTAAVATAAHGQVVRSLAPGAFEAAQGDSLSLRLVEQGGDEAAWPATEMNYFFVRVAGTQENRPTLEAVEGEVSWTLAHDGLTVIGVDLDERDEEVSRASLTAFLDRAGAGVAAPAGEVTVVRRLESFKTLVRVGDDRRAADAATDKTSLDVDIRLLMDPTSIRAGSALALRTYVRGNSAKGQTVIATHLPSGRMVSCETDSSGIGSVVLPWEGAWRLEFHAVEPAADDAPMRISSSTVTFEVKGARP